MCVCVCVCVGVCVCVCVAENLFVCICRQGLLVVLSRGVGAGEPRNADVPRPL